MLIILFITSQPIGRFVFDLYCYSLRFLHPQRFPSHLKQFAVSRSLSHKGFVSVYGLSLFLHLYFNRRY